MLPPCASHVRQKATIPSIEHPVNDIYVVYVLCALAVAVFAFLFYDSAAVRIRKLADKKQAMVSDSACFVGQQCSSASCVRF